MEQIWSAIDVGTKVITLIGVGLVTYIGLMIKTSIFEVKLEQANVKTTLIQSQSEDRVATDKSIADINQTFAVHAKADELNFKAITDGIQRIENRIINGGTK